MYVSNSNGKAIGKSESEKNSVLAQNNTLCTVSLWVQILPGSSWCVGEFSPVGVQGNFQTRGGQALGLAEHDKESQGQISRF